jgi:hypothetical protein
LRIGISSWKVSTAGIFSNGDGYSSDTLISHDNENRAERSVPLRQW